MSESAPETEQLILCPYCGHAQHGGDRCLHCSGLFEPLSRRATQIAMGPWFIRDKVHPFKPGCSYNIIKRMALGGKIKPTTVMRGPTTKQFWSIARNVPGVAHLIGYCHGCAAHVGTDDPKCLKCGAQFTEPRERDAMGLAYRTAAEVQRAQAALDAELRGEAPPQPAPAPTMPPPPTASPPQIHASPSPSQAELLNEVMDISGGQAPAALAGAGLTQPAATPIEFAPSADTGQAGTSAFDIAPTGPIPDTRGFSPIVWFLVAANIIVVSSLIIFMLMK